MEIFTARFFGGTILVGLGILSLITGIFSLFPPTNQVLIGLILIIVGLVLTSMGYKFAKDVLPSGAKTAVDTLQKSKIQDKTRKK